VYNSIKNFGYAHYHVEASKLIREGVISRDDALEELKLNFDKELLDQVGAELGYKFE
jgi:hypothetical protein